MDHISLPPNLPPGPWGKLVELWVDENGTAHLEQEKPHYLHQWGKPIEHTMCLGCVMEEDPELAEYYYAADSTTTIISMIEQLADETHTEFNTPSTAHTGVLWDIIHGIDWELKNIDTYWETSEKDLGWALKTIWDIHWDKAYTNLCNKLQYTPTVAPQGTHLVLFDMDDGRSHIETPHMLSWAVAPWKGERSTKGEMVLCLVPEELAESYPYSCKVQPEDDLETIKRVAYMPSGSLPTRLKLARATHL